MIPLDDDQPKTCVCGHIANEVFVDAEAQETEWWCEDCERKRDNDQIVIKCSAYGLL